MNTALDESFEGSSEEIYNYLKTTIKKVAIEALGVKERLKIHKNGMTTEIIQLIGDEKTAYHKWMSSKKTNTKNYTMRRKKQYAKEVRHVQE